MNNIYSFFEEIGLKGLLLRNMEAVVKTENDLNRFKSFIIANDNSFKSNLELVNLYICSLDDVDKNVFIDDYQACISIDEKKNSLESLFQSYVNPIVVNKVELFLEKGLTLDKLYDKVIKYRRSYNPLLITKKIQTELEIIL